MGKDKTKGGMMATQLSKNDISAILNVLCQPRLQLQYRCEEFNTTLRQNVEWKPEYLDCWNGQPIEAFMPAHMPFCLGMNVLEPRPVVWVDIPLKFKTVQGIVRFTISDHVWYYDLPVTRAGMALYDALYKRFDGKVNLHLSLGGVVNAGEPTEEELERLRKFTAIIVFDTCSIMNYPNLLDGVNDGELVIVPKVVNNDLENHKVKHYFDDRQKKAQRAISAIFNYKRRFPLEYAESLLDLVPAEYRVDEGEKELNDNKILAVAIRYKAYTDIPVIFITDDKSLANRADGEGIEVWTAQDFLTPPESSFEEDDEAEVIADESESEEAKVAEEERKKKAQEEFLAQKISTKLLHVESSQISLLQNYGVKTLAQFMAQTEESFSQMRAKNGMTFTAKFLKEQSAIQHKLETL
jgi:rRNA-processing protein FCF1